MQRITDPRLRRLLAASLAELLHTADYEPGAYGIVLGFAIPNTEIVPVREADGGEGAERLGVDPGTREVLETHLKGATWRVERTAPDGSVALWEFALLAVMPQAQTTGTLVAVTRALLSPPNWYGT